MALYRFRNTRRLLGSKELEEQYLFFASSDSQNDPSEGIVDFYWQGDSVAWMGLVKNYAWQILWLLFSWPACRNALEIKELVYLRRSGYCLEGTQIDSMRLEVEKRIAHDERIIAFVDALGNFGFKLLARHLIHAIIPSIHIIALYYADQVLQENGIKTIFPQSVRKSLFDKENAYKMLNAMLQIIGEGYDSLEKTSRLNETMMPEFEYYQSKLMISNVERLGEEVKGAFEIIQFVVSFFPQEYVKLITRLVFPEWYCICFCEAIEDPALWGYYADGHKGVCLIFDNDLRIKSPKKTNNDRRFVAEKVVYGNPTADFNFFRGLGALFGDEREHWLIHEGQRSLILDEMLDNEEEFRNEYWPKYKQRYFRKGERWKNEKERRMVIDNYWEDYSCIDARKFKYDFCQLKGIIFGAKTPIEEKRQIIDIIKEKCRENGRTEFSFYQAMDDSTHNIIQINPYRIPINK